MQESISWLALLAVGGTLAVLVVGVLSMLRPGKPNARRSQTLMRFRVGFQLAAIVLLGVIFLMNLLF